MVPTPEQLGKIRSELDIVHGNISVMSEMLTEMTPGQEESGDLQLLQVKIIIVHVPCVPQSAQLIVKRCCCIMP